MSSMRRLFGCFVHDSRKKLHSVPEPDWKLGLAGLDPRRQHLARLRATLRGISLARKARLLGAGWLGLMFGGGLYYAPTLNYGRVDAFGYAVVSVLVGGTAAWAVWRFGVRAVDISLANELFLACRLCVCCGYDLVDLRPEPDGCTVCPECGAAWDLRTAEGVQERMGRLDEERL